MRLFQNTRIYGIILIIFLCGATKNSNALKITYLGNCGFLYENDTLKVLIDPFGTDFGNFFYLPSNDTRTNILEGKTPFNNINLLLITHIHGDHFNASLAESFLLKNDKVKMICPPQVYNQMRDSCKNFNKIESKIISPQLAIDESKEMTTNNIPLTIFRLQHGTTRSLEGVAYSDYTEYEKTQNFGYLIRFKNNSIFHQGDACLKINSEALNKIDGPVNIAHLGYFDWDSTSLSIVKNNLNAEKVIFMHGTKPGQELQTEPFKNIVPQLIFFQQELESKTFD